MTVPGPGRRRHEPRRRCGHQVAVDDLLNTTALEHPELDGQAGHPALDQIDLEQTAPIEDAAVVSESNDQGSGTR